MVVAPDWLAKRLRKDWFDLYGNGRRVENYRLPKLDSEREALGNQMGEDGFGLLKKIYAKNAPELLRMIPAVETLRSDYLFYIENFTQENKMKQDFKIHSVCLVKNEADIIEHCLTEAAKWSDRIYVYDGESTDGTWEKVLAMQNETIIPWKRHDKSLSILV